MIRKRQMPVLPQPEAAVREALAAPVGAPPLAELARGKTSACILICDITRPVPNGLFLPILVRAAARCRARRRARSRSLVATGLHRPNEGAELEELVGSRWVLETVRVENHFARDDAAHVDLGTTPTPRRAGQARPPLRRGRPQDRDRPGRAAFHGRLLGRPQGDRTRRRAQGHHHDLPQRPLHGAPQRRRTACSRAIRCTRTQLEIVEMLGGALALNTVIDEERRLSFVNFGEIVASHLAAVRHCADYAEVPVAERFRRWSPALPAIRSTRPTIRPSRAWWRPWTSWRRAAI